MTDAVAEAGEAEPVKCELLTEPISREHFLLNGTFCEFVPHAILKAIRYSQLVPENDDKANAVDNDDSGDKYPKNPRLMFELYCRGVAADGFVSLALCPPKGVSTDRFYGRVYANKSMSLACLTRYVRNTICIPRAAIGWGGYYDFDMHNAHPKLALSICRQHLQPHEFEHLERFCTDRARVLSNIQEVFGIEDKDIAKNLPLRLFFGGTCQGWFAESKKYFRRQNVTIEDMPPLLRLLQLEIGKISEFLKNRNRALWNSILTSESKKPNTQHKNVVGRFFARYFQNVETQIMSFVAQNIVENTTCARFQDRTILVYEYDGLKLLRESVDIYLGEQGMTMDDFTDWMNRIVLDQFRLEVLFQVKEMEQSYNVDEFIGRDLTVDEKPITEFLDQLNNVSPNSDTPGFASQGAIAKFVIKRDNDFIYDQSEVRWYCWERRDSTWRSFGKSEPVIPLRNAISAVDKFLTDKRDSLLSLLELPHWDVLRLWESEDWLTKAPHMTPKGIAGLMKCFERIAVVQKELATHNFLTSVLEMCKDYACVPEIKFNQNPEYLGFQDGVFELRAGIHRPYVKEDYMTFKCAIPYEPNDFNMQPRIEKLQAILKTIHPDQDVLDFVLLTFASSLTAYAPEHFWLFNGAGRNGKGLLDETMIELLGPDYCLSQLDPKLLTQKLQANCPIPELADMSKKRLVLTREPSEAEKFQNDTIKSLTGGAKGLRARRLYANTEDVELCGTIICECNKRPKLAHEPTDAERERIFDVLWGSRFTNDASLVNHEERIFLADPTLKDPQTKKNMAIAIFHILQPYVQIFLRNNLRITPVPEAVKERTKAYMKSAYLVLTVFKDIYEDCEHETFVELDKILKKLKSTPPYLELEKKDKRLFTEDHLKSSLEVEFGPRLVPRLNARNRMTLHLANVVCRPDFLVE